MKGVIRGSGDRATYHLDGRVVTRDEFFAAFPPVVNTSGAGLIGWRPIHSDALAVHPLDIPEAVADAKAKGVPTEFLPDGRAVLTSRSHRKAYLRAYGFHDRQGGYGD